VRGSRSCRSEIKATPLDKRSTTSPTGHRLAEHTGAERALVLDSQLGAIDKEAARVRKLVG
jgi:hypothetical protein